MCILKDAFSVNDKNKIVHINNSFPTSLHQCSDTQYQDNSNYQRYSPSSFFNNVQKYTDIDWNQDFSPQLDYNPTFNYNPQSNMMNKWVGTLAGRAIGFGPMMDYQNQRRGNMPGMPRCFEPDDGGFDPFNQYQAPRRPFHRGRRPMPRYYDPYDYDDDDDEVFTPWGDDYDDDPLFWSGYSQPGLGGGYAPNYYQPYSSWQMPQTYGQGFPFRRGRRARNPYWPIGTNW